MARSTVVTGKVCGYRERAFDSFKGQDGNPVPAGVSRSLWLSEDFGSDPVEVRVGPEVTDLVADLDFGSEVEASCDVFINNNSERLVLRRLVAV